MKKKLEVRCSNPVVTKSGREIKCGAFQFAWLKGVFSVSCRKCGTMYFASPKADGSIEVRGVQKGQAVMTSHCEKDN